MKYSRKMSFASFVAIGLPVAGFAGATAQALQPAAPAASASMPGGDGLTLQSSAAAPLTTADQDARSNGALSQIATVRVSAATAEAAAEVVVDTSIDPMRGWSEADFDAYAAYWEAGYNYNQLLTLAEEWNLSEFEAKARAGDAILAGDTSSFDDIVAGIEPFAGEVATGEDPLANPTEAFWDAGFTYEDALALAEAWNIDSWDAKILASEMIEDGKQGDVEALLSI